MDNIDKAILHLLQRDCSLSYASIAASVSLSVNACHRRVKALEESGVIARRVVIINKKMVGVARTVVLFVKLEKNSREQIELAVSIITGHHQVRECYQLIGAQDIFVKISFRNDNEFTEFYNKMFENKNVVGVYACPVIEEFKDSSAISLD